MPLGGRISVLIADDELLIAEALRNALEPKYHVVATVADGAAAVQAVEQHQPDIVLLDISMPVMNGLQTAERIAQSCPSVRIIIVTNHTDHAYLEEAFERGAAGYVQKGSTADLEEAIHRVLDGQHYRPTFAR
jgi:two-component system nitrate/nitrite response regulator NarL